MSPICEGCISFPKGSTMSKQKKIGTVINYEYVSTIQIIDNDTMKWKTITPVLDTPNEIKKMKEKLEAEGYKNLWKYNTLSGRTML